MKDLNAPELSTTCRRRARAGAAAPFILARNAAFRLGEGRVFAGFDWCFRRGEQWASVRENGSGKSALGDALRGKLALALGKLRYTT